MTERQYAFWRCELGNWLCKLTKEQQEQLLLIVTSMGPFRACRDIVTDLDEILGPVTELMTKGL